MDRLMDLLPDLGPGRGGELVATCPACQRWMALRVLGGEPICERGCTVGAIREALHLESESAGPEPAITWLSDVAPQPVRWLWPDRIPLAAITLIAGNPGVGKSTLSTDIAARVSTGSGWPDRPTAMETPGGVVLLSAEDDLARTIRPRLDAAGADCARIAALQGTRRRDPETGEEAVSPLTLREDLRRIDETIERTRGCRLVVIDPVSAYLGETNSHRNAEVRGLLAPLATLAERRDVAVVLVEHLNKSPGGPAIYRSQGSIAFVGAARAAFAVAEDQEAKGRVLMLPTKSNLSPVRTGLAYELRDAPNGRAQVAWEADPIHTTADDALCPERAAPGPEADARSEAAEWLRGLLSFASYRVQEVQRMVRGEEWSWRTVQSARREIGAQSRRSGFGAGAWWTLPGGGDAEPPFAQDTRPAPQAPNNLARMDEPCANDDRSPQTPSPNGENPPSPPFAQGSGGDGADGDDLPF